MTHKHLVLPESKNQVFQKLDRTNYPPQAKPIMVWDGACGFCKYWITRWSKFTGSKVVYEPYQTAAERFLDIDVVHFKQASRLIEADGSIFSGPRSAYRTFTYGGKWAFLDKWYVEKKWFQSLSDISYAWIERNRNFLFKVTKALFGSDPHEVRPFWMIYLGIVLYFMYMAF